MARLITLLLVILLAACGSGGALTQTPTPRPTNADLPTLAPVGPTILPSDLKTPPPTLAPGQEAFAATPIPTTALVSTPAAAGFDAALRPEFRGELGLVSDKTFYRMRWELNDDLSELEGWQRVTLANKTGKPLNEVFFRLFANYPGSDADIQIDAVRVAGRNVVPTLQMEDTVLRVPMARPLSPGRIVSMELEYSIQIPLNSSTRYTDFVRKDWITTLPTVYPIVPAYDADGWHLELPPPYGDLVYADSSIYDVTITTPSGYVVIASGEMVDETTGGGRTSRRFIAAPMRDFDANITNALEKSTAMVGNITVNSWYRPAHADSGKRALDWVVDAIQVFETRFGPYPFKELDLVETPTTAGGIEYPGVITVASDLYADPAQAPFFEFAVVHETAHQWFYSAVGSDQINHPWLDESLVQYASLMYYEDQYGPEQERNIREQFFDRQYEAAKQVYGDRPAGLPVNAYDEEAYGAFIYAKGPKFFQAVRDQIGDEDFNRALKTYYRDFKYRNARPQDLVSIFNTVSGEDITPLYDLWIGG
jgi:hypothetical protein